MRTSHLAPSRRLAAILATLALTASAFAACDDDDDDTTAPQRNATVALSPANEIATTPVVSTATGTATFTIVGNTLTYAVGVSNLTTTPVGAHIHSGPPTANGPIIFDFFPTGTTIPSALTNPALASGTIDLTSANISNRANVTISGDSLRKLLAAGQLYTNVHTTRFPGGEIRGNIPSF